MALGVPAYTRPMPAHASKSGAGRPRWPLWSVLWRTLVFGPILWPFGALFFLMVAVSICGPPICVFVLFVDGRYLLAPLLLAGWLSWLRFGVKLLRWMSQGFGYSGL